MSNEEIYTELTDEQCDEFRRMPASFRDMVRAIHKAGFYKGALSATTLLEPFVQDVADQLSEDECNNCSLADDAIGNLTEEMGRISQGATA